MNSVPALSLYQPRGPLACKRSETPAVFYYVSVSAELLYNCWFVVCRRKNKFAGPLDGIIFLSLCHTPTFSGSGESTYHTLHTSYGPVLNDTLKADLSYHKLLLCSCSALYKRPLQCPHWCGLYCKIHTLQCSGINVITREVIIYFLFVCFFPPCI